MAYIPGLPPNLDPNRKPQSAPAPQITPTTTTLPDGGPTRPQRTVPGNWFQNWRANRPGPRVPGSPTGSTPPAGPSVSGGPAPVSGPGARLPIYSAPAGPTRLPAGPNAPGRTYPGGPVSGDRIHDMGPDHIGGERVPGAVYRGDFSAYNYPDWFMQGVLQYGMNPDQAAEAWAATGLPIPMAPSPSSPSPATPAPSPSGGNSVPRPPRPPRPQHGSAQPIDISGWFNPDGTLSTAGHEGFLNQYQWGGGVTSPRTMDGFFDAQGRITPIGQQALSDWSWGQSPSGPQANPPQGVQGAPQSPAPQVPRPPRGPYYGAY